MTDGGPAPALARSTLDRAAHRRTDPEWLGQAWGRCRVLVLDSGNAGRALVSAGPESPALVLVDPEEVPEEAAARAIFLGVEPDGVPVFTVDAPLPVLPGTRAAHLLEVGHLLTDRDAGLLTTGLALLNWHRGHRYSPRTGQATTMDEAGWSRVAPAGERMWPRTDPAMIVLVHDGGSGQDGRCLLGNNAAWPRVPGELRFSCLAGYVEPGESAEAAVLREVREEVDVPVTDITYVGSQAWPFPGLLMLGFQAVADPRHPVRVDPAEITAARWFTRSEVSAALAGQSVAVEEARLVLPPSSSIASFLLRYWLDGHC
ncbi:NAD(+) diphosphatase [Salinispora pacifica]|uniref:NAD(+) diphosphatase n=1 Tax=Salinispora pacifica TaxID=351187 RepID=UPI000380DB98|nr:NAD(+) diphosphatase [Salinispora pacifica]